MAAIARMQPVLVVQRVMSAVTALRLSLPPSPLSLAASLPPPPLVKSLRSADAALSCALSQKAAAGNAEMYS